MVMNKKIRLFFGICILVIDENNYELLLSKISILTFESIFLKSFIIMDFDKAVIKSAIKSEFSSTKFFFIYVINNVYRKIE